MIWERWMCLSLTNKSVRRNGTVFLPMLSVQVDTTQTKDSVRYVFCPFIENVNWFLVSMLSSLRNWINKWSFFLLTGWFWRSSGVRRGGCWCGVFQCTKIVTTQIDPTSIQTYQNTFPGSRSFSSKINVKCKTLTFFYCVVLGRLLASRTALSIRTTDTVIVKNSVLQNGLS